MVISGLPLFPLKTVLFPGGVLPLRVFEPRYLTMVSECLREGNGFGVLLIKEGEEVGEAETFKIGTIAQIVDWDQGSDGLLGITVEGRQRFRLESAEKRNDGLYIGEPKRIADELGIPVPDDYQFLVDLLKDVLDELGSYYQHLVKKYDDSSWVGFRLTEALPLTPTTKQELLEMNDPLARLSLLTTYIRTESR
jgi:Lon protease-like protein